MNPETESVTSSTLAISVGVAPLLRSAIKEAHEGTFVTLRQCM